VQNVNIRDRIKDRGANLSSHLKYALRDRGVCANKLKSILNLNKLPVNSVHIHGGVGGTQYEILKTTGVNLREAIFEYKGLQTHKYIGGSNAHLGYLKIGFSTQYDMNQIDTTYVPIYMVYQGSQLVSCHSTALDAKGDTLEDKICMTTKGGNYMYNPAVYGCVLKSYLTAKN
jgi:hypothetical protein